MDVNSLIAKLFLSIPLRVYLYCFYTFEKSSQSAVVNNLRFLGRTISTSAPVFINDKLVGVVGLDFGLRDLIAELGYNIHDIFNYYFVMDLSGKFPVNSSKTILNFKK